MLVLIVIIIIDLHRTASVLTALNVAGAVVAAGCEGTRTRWFAGGRGADCRALGGVSMIDSDCIETGRGDKNIPLRRCGHCKTAARRLPGP